jgi:hypothetical protein
MLIYTHQKSKKKNKTKKEMAEYDAWLKSVNSQTTNFSNNVKIRKVKFNTTTIPKLTCPPGRETVRHPSLNSIGGNGIATKPTHGKVYTGTAMLGIGTLHKSNAVPIFTDEEARDQANMRR